jgi:dTDP-glucose 4,6-dehydratase
LTVSARDKRAGRQTASCYGDGLNVRDWLYVEDRYRGIDAVLHSGQNGESLYIGSRAEKTNFEIVHTLRDLLEACA